MVNAKSTKAQILAAYNKALDELKQRETEQHNPEQKAQARAKQETLQSVNLNTRLEDLDQLQKAQRACNQNFATLITQYEEAQNTLAELQLAIDYRTAELKEIHEIETEANSLAALAIARNELDAKTQAHHENLAKACQQKIEELERKYETVKQQRELAQERLATDWQYEFEREKKLKHNELQDEIDAKSKEHGLQLAKGERYLDERETELNERIRKFEQAEKELEDLRNEASQFELRLKEAVKEESAKVYAVTDKQQNYAIQQLTIQKDAEIRVLTNKVEMAEKQLTDLATQLKTQDSELRDAYAQINALALKSVDTSQQVRAMNDARAFLVGTDKPNSKNAS